jgi:chromosome segregation ATPase
VQNLRTREQAAVVAAEALRTQLEKLSDAEHAVDTQRAGAEGRAHAAEASFTQLGTELASLQEKYAATAREASAATAAREHADTEIATPRVSLRSRRPTDALSGRTPRGSSAHSP